MNKNWIICSIIPMVLVCSLMIARPQYRTGDDTISYAMSYSLFDGWMEPTSKIELFFSPITDSNIVCTSINYFNGTVGEILRRGKEAAILHLETPPQTKWHDQSEIYRWSHITPETRFNFFSTYYNALTDGGQPALYYLLLNFFGSLIPHLSSFNYPAYVINVISIIISFYYIKRICTYLNMESSLVYILCGGVPLFYKMSMMLRSYWLMTAFLLIFLYENLKLINCLEKGEKLKWKNVSLVAVSFVFGSLSHYLMVVVVAITFLFLLFFEWKNIWRAGYKAITMLCLTFGLSFALILILDVNLIKGIFLLATGRLYGNEMDTSFISKISELIQWARSKPVSTAFYIIIIVSFLVLMIVTIKKDRKVLRNKSILYIFCLTLCYYPLVLIGFKPAFRYYFPIWVVFSICLTWLIYRCLKYKWIRIIIASVFLSCAMISTYSIADSFISLENTNDLKENILLHYPTELAVTYNDWNMTDNYVLYSIYKNVYMGGKDDIGFFHFPEDDIIISQDTPRIILFISEQYVDMLDEIRANMMQYGYHISKQIYSSDNERIYLMEVER